MAVLLTDKLVQPSPRSDNSATISRQQKPNIGCFFFGPGLLLFNTVASSAPNVEVST
jgi:hypothetical protein